MGIHYKSALIHFNTLLIKQNDGHWILRTKPLRGYSRFEHEDKNIYAHVFAYKTLVGEIPPGMELHHTCEYKRCCNPEHLQPLYHADHIKLDPNNITNINRLKTHCPSGHAYDVINTGYDKTDRSRYCKLCNRLAARNRVNKL